MTMRRLAWLGLKRGSVGALGTTLASGLGSCVEALSHRSVFLQSPCICHLKGPFLPEVTNSCLGAWLPARQLPALGTKADVQHLPPA